MSDDVVGVAAGVSETVTAQPVPRPAIGRLSDQGGASPVPGDVDAGIDAARGDGSALPLGVKTPMERTFGRSFDGVRVHADARSDQMNQALGSRAFTAGSDVFFRSGEYQPRHPDGTKLLAHELTHVVQQAGAAPAVQRSVATIQAGQHKRLNQPVLKGQRRSKALQKNAAQGVKTKVAFTPGQVRTGAGAGAVHEDVGRGMEGVIGPDHPQGSQPDQAAHQRAFLHLQATHGDYFVRGHLLNGDLGGPGGPFNLYPITKQANSLHFQRVEKPVKDWVNTNHLYVYYKVGLTHPNPLEPLDARFQCTAYPLRNTYPNDRTRATNGGLIEVGITSTAQNHSGVVDATTEDGRVGADALKEIDQDIIDSIEYQGGKMPKGYVQLEPDQMEQARVILSHPNNVKVENLLSVRAGLGKKSIEKLVEVVHGATAPTDIDKQTWNAFANVVNNADLDAILRELEEPVVTRSDRKVKTPQRFNPFG